MIIAFTAGVLCSYGFGSTQGNFFPSVFSLFLPYFEKDILFFFFPFKQYPKILLKLRY